MNQGLRTQNEEADRVSIDQVVESFFAAFSNRGQLPPQLDGLRDLFSADAVIVKRSNGSVETMSVNAFIEPRQALLCSGALTEFSEFEQESETVILRSLACRWSIYGKSLHARRALWRNRQEDILLHPRGRRLEIVSAIWEDD